MKQLIGHDGPGKISRPGLVVSGQTDCSAAMRLKAAGMQTRKGEYLNLSELKAEESQGDQAMRKSIVPKDPARKALCLVAGLAVAALSYPVSAAPASGGDTVQGLYDALLGTMKNGRILGQSGRVAQLEPVIRRTFDIPSLTRFAVGVFWATLSEAQRQQVTESFGRYISAIYADRFDSYAGQKLQVTGEQPNAGGVTVKSQIIKANGDPVNVDYMMRRNGNAWLISDIYLDGAISEVATRRSEFAAILKNQGIDGLIAALNRKADILTGTTARSF